MPPLRRMIVCTPSRRASQTKAHSLKPMGAGAFEIRSDIALLGRGRLAVSQSTSVKAVGKPKTAMSRDDHRLDMVLLLAEALLLGNSLELHAVHPCQPLAPQLWKAETIE